VLNKILNDGAEPVQLLGLLSYNFRRLLMAKEMMDRGDDRRDIAGILKMRYQGQQDFLAAARRADRRQLITVFDRLAETDLAMKTSLGGGGNQGTRMQIEVLVCEITAAMGR
jgi:DNA polymerase III delta subunit